MAVTEYVGPIVGLHVEGEWSSTNSYESLALVSNEGNSYVARQDVPIGVDITNEDYWWKSANFNAQLEAYIQQVSTFQAQLNNKASTISLAAQAANTSIMSSIYGEIRQNANQSQQGACMYQIGNQTFLFCAMKPGTGATDTNTYGYIYNVNTNMLVTSSSIQNAGHANCACYNQNEACIVLSGCDTGIGNYNIIKLNPRTLAVISTATPSTNFIGMAYDNVNKVYYAFNQSYIYVLDINFNITSSFAFDSSTMTTQGCYYYDNIFYLPDSNTQSIYMFDVTNKMALINIATLTDWPNTTYIEIEQITGIGNDMYIVSQIYNDAITCIFNILVNPNNTFTNYAPSSNVYADYSIAASFGTNTSNNPSCSIYPFVFFDKYDQFYFNGTIEHPISLTKKQYQFNNGTFTNTLMMNNGSITFNNCTFTGANVSTGQVITGIYADYIFNDVTIQHDNVVGMFVQTGNIRFNSITFVNKSSVNHLDAVFQRNVQIYVGSITQTYPYSITNAGQAITNTKQLSIETLESNTYTIPLINAYRNLEFMINTTNETINANFGVQINAIWLNETQTEFRGSGISYVNSKAVGVNVYGTLVNTTLTIYITVINITDNAQLPNREIKLFTVRGIS